MSLKLYDEGNGGELGTAAEPSVGGDLLEDSTVMSLCYHTLYAGSSPLDALKGQDVRRDEFLKISRAARLTPSSLKAMGCEGTTLLATLVKQGIFKSVAAECQNPKGERVSTRISGELPNGSPFAFSL